jgi:hypothetical protein
VFDGTEIHQGWTVVVQGANILAAGSGAESSAPAGATTIDMPGMTLLPGLIDAHTHIFLHPYSETPWTQQVLAEPLAVRTARAVVHVRNTLMAGFTTIRDLGTEGAGNSDVGIKQAIEQGIIPGPRMLVVTRAIVATGAYGPPRDLFSFEPPQGAQEADGPEIQHAVREQIGHGADWVKLYADYGWGPSPSRRRAPQAERSPRTRRPPRGCAGQSLPASRRSSTATRERRRSSGPWSRATSRSAPRSKRPTRSPHTAGGILAPTRNRHPSSRSARACGPHSMPE